MRTTTNNNSTVKSLQRFPIIPAILAVAIFCSSVYADPDFRIVPRKSLIESHDYVLALDAETCRYLPARVRFPAQILMEPLNLVATDQRVFYAKYASKLSVKPGYVPLLGFDPSPCDLVIRQFKNFVQVDRIVKSLFPLNSEDYRRGGKAVGYVLAGGAVLDLDISSLQTRSLRELVEQIANTTPDALQGGGEIFGEQYYSSPQIHPGTRIKVSTATLLDLIAPEREANESKSQSPCEGYLAVDGKLSQRLIEALLARPDVDPELLNTQIPVILKVLENQSELTRRQSSIANILQTAMKKTSAGN